MNEQLSAEFTIKDAQFLRGVDRLVGGLDRIEQKSKATEGQLDKSFNRGREAMGRMSSSANDLGELVVKGFAIDRVLAFGQAIGVTSGKFERFEAVLTNALGSRSGAKDSLAMLTDFAAATPNQLDELTGAFIKFVNRGLVPTRQQLTNFGDLAASQGRIRPTDRGYLRCSDG